MLDQPEKVMIAAGVALVAGATVVVLGLNVLHWMFG